jgi:hypothetical protein
VQLGVGILGPFAEDLKGLIGGYAVRGHQDSFGLFDDRLGLKLPAEVGVLGDQAVDRGRDPSSVLF